MLILLSLLKSKNILYILLNQVLMFFRRKKLDNRVLEIYGNPASRDGQDMDYDDDEGRLIRIRIKKDRVEWIYVGALDD